MKNILEQLAIDFIEKHFDEIDLKKCDWDVENKDEAIKEIKESNYIRDWVITETMDWGTLTNYIEKYKVENHDGNFILKIKDRYFRFANTFPPALKEVFPKKVIIEKLIFD
jgi:hypothetical protein